MKEWILEQEIEFPGTVSNVTWSERAGAWLASPAGLFHEGNGRWQLVQKQVPFWHLNAVTVQGSTILASGLPKGILRSAVGGRQWEMAWVEQTNRPITCIIPSPNLKHDGVWLAGTHGDGVLRSTDNGRHWQLSNWGLRDFTIIDLVSAPVWGEREFLFAVTAEGLYQSPNGGRAWRYIGESFESDPAQACAVSAHFADDQTVWMGTENGALFVSTDRGRHWETAVSAFTQFKTITALSINEEGTLLLGVGAQGIWKMADEGTNFTQTIQPQLAENQPILTLNVKQNCGYAGLLNGGLWYTGDGGDTWTAVSGLTAGRFMWLEGQNGSSLVGGPNVGLWQDGQAESLENQEPILAVVETENGRYLSQPSGVSLNDRSVWRSESPVVQLTSIGKNSCLGLTQAGTLCLLEDGEYTLLPSPEGQAVAMAGNQAVILCATFIPKRKEIVLMVVDRSSDATAWQPIGDFPSGDGKVQLSVSDDNVVFAGFGRTVRQISLQDGQVKSEQITSQSTPIISIAHLGDVTAVASVESLWVYQNVEKGWQSVQPFPNGEAIADIQLVQSETGIILKALTGDGRLWAILIDSSK